MPTEVRATRPQAICSVASVTKRYGGVQALGGIDLEVYPGRVHAVVGENGAGKSTLMKILSGAERQDEGELLLEGKSVSFKDVKQANDQGVAIVFQELSLFPELDILSNLFVLREPRRYGFVLRDQMKRRARPVLQDLGLALDLDAAVHTLTLGQQQLVEIAKALLAKAKLLILDEPNSALNAVESDRLFTVVRKLRDRGVAVLYISHRLEEVFAIADCITVMRNGLIVTQLDVKDTSIPEVVTAMIGREPSQFYGAYEREVGSGSSLRIENVSRPGTLEGITLRAQPGEIVGLAGLEGSGTKEILGVVFGTARRYSGAVRLPNGETTPKSPFKAVKAGVAFVPSDRRRDGLMLEQSVLHNLSQVTAGVLGRLGFFLNNSAMRARAVTRTKNLHVKLSSVDAPVGSLSGGNQQKVVLGKWLEADPSVVLLDDPTRGVDVGAKEEIYRVVHELSSEGRVVLFTSSELSEFVHLCDRVLVFYKGRICGSLPKAALSTQRLLEAINTGRV